MKLPTGGGKGVLPRHRCLNFTYCKAYRRMILTDDMLAVAFQYRDTRLWEVLTDGDVFALRLSDGGIGYCCIMGNGGEHLSLGLYRGSKGFSSYLKTISMSDMRPSGIEWNEMLFSLDLIKCDFVQAADMNANTKKMIRKYVEANGLKIQRSKGWPDFTRHLPFKMPSEITFEEDACDMVGALRAAVAVAEELKHRTPASLGFDEDGDYPTMNGGKVVPFLIPNAEGSYDWTTTELPAFLPDEYPTPKFKYDIPAFTLKKQPAIGIWQMRYIYMPTPIDGAENEIPYLPGVLVCMDAESGMLFPAVFSLDGKKDEYDQILLSLANDMIAGGNRPRIIEVGDERTESLLKNFCVKCGILLSRKERLPELENACELMIGNIHNFV